MDKILAEKIAIKAIDKIIEGLASSDFITECGTLAIDRVRTFRLDMVNDIVNTIVEETTPK